MFETKATNIIRPLWLTTSSQVYGVYPNLHAWEVAEGGAVNYLVRPRLKGKQASKSKHPSPSNSNKPMLNHQLVLFLCLSSNLPRVFLTLVHTPPPLCLLVHGVHIPPRAKEAQTAKRDRQLRERLGVRLGVSHICLCWAL